VKTAISIPDPIFAAAESLAKRLGISRSQLFSRAVAAYVETHKHSKLRASLDEVYNEENSDIDEALAQMQWASLSKEDW